MDEQIEFIRRDIRLRGIEMQALEDDLLDHICCAIEDKMENNNQNFDEAYLSTISAFGPNGLKEVQEETIYLLTFKNYYAMKTTMNVFGFISSFLLVAGSLFKLMHWPGAGIMLVVGIFLFSFIFLPLLLTIKLKELKEGESKIMQVIAFVAGFIISLGVLFKIMHWPGANIMLVSSGLILLLVFLPMALIKVLKEPERKINSLTTIIFFVVGFSLFFTLLRVSTSENVLNASAIVDFHLTKTIDDLTSKNTMVYGLIEKAKAENTMSADRYEKATKVKELSGGLNHYIADLKAHLLMETEEISIDEAKKRHLVKVDSRAKTNFDIPTHILIGDPENPKTSGYAAWELKNKIDEYRVNMLAVYEKDMKAIAEQTMGLTTYDFPPVNGKTYTWTTGNFDHVPLMGVIPVLSKIQADVKQAEADAILYLYGQQSHSISDDAMSENIGGK